MEKTEMIESLIYTKPRSLQPIGTHYCPGCTHGIAHRLVAEVIDEMGIREQTIGVAPVGCAVFIYNYFDVDFAEASHGRAPAMATGIKRANPDKFVFTYQGDGDLASIGAAEILHAANRGEKISVIFINNGIYGMTGGQMAPTTIEGWKTTSSPMGRNVELHGYPIRMSEILAQIEGSAYIVRRSLHNVANIRRAKKAIRTAFEVQRMGLGLAMVELLSSCPTNWKISPDEALKVIEEKMLPVYPLGDFKVDPAIQKHGKGW